MSGFDAHLERAYMAAGNALWEAQRDDMTNDEYAAAAVAAWLAVLSEDRAIEALDEAASDLELSTAHATGASNPAVALLSVLRGGQS